MKKTQIVIGLILALLFPIVGYGEDAGEIIRQDKIKIGRPGSSADKEIILDIGAGDANPRFRTDPAVGVLEFSNDGVNFKKVGSGAGQVVNLLPNGDVETGTLIGWNNTGGGTLAVTTTGVEVGFGNAALDFDAAAPSDDVRSDQLAIPEGLLSQNCLARIHYKGGDTNLALEAIDGSSNVLGSVTLAAAVGYRTESLSFVCPASGTVALRVIASATAAQIFLDNMHLGENFLVGQVSQSEMIGTARWEAVAGCIWTNASAPLNSYPLDTDCSLPIITGKLDSPGEKRPSAMITNFEPGNYVIMAQGNFEANTSTECVWRFTSTVADADGVTNSGTLIIRSADDVRSNTLIGRYRFDQAFSNMNFSIEASMTGASSCDIKNIDSLHDLEITVIRYPLASQESMRFDQVAWRVDANQGGDDPSVGTGNQTTYAEIPSASLDTVVNIGSIATLQACATTEESSGTTCSGNESIGISFDLPTAGDVRACVSFSHLYDLPAGSDASVTFQIVETPNNAQTISQEGKIRLPHRHESISGTEIQTVPFRLCGDFSFVSSGKKTLRLFFEQEVITGPITTSTIQADRNAARGQQDIHWEVSPINQLHPALLLVNAVVSANILPIRVVDAIIDNDGVNCPINEQLGDWILSTMRNGAGQCQVTFKTGTFSATPVICQCTGATTSTNCTIGTDSLTIVAFETDLAGVATDRISTRVSCRGPR